MLIVVIVSGVRKLDELFRHVHVCGLERLGSRLLPLHEVVLEVADVVEQLRVHGQFLPGDVLSRLEVGAHVVFLVVHHRVLELGDDLALHRDQVGLLLHALQVII